MVKKSRRQREGTERVYQYNVVDEDFTGENIDYVETSVACDESSSTMFQPETSNKRQGDLRLSKKLRLKKRPSQHTTSQREEEGAPEGMHAVANGEREAFSTAPNNNGTHLEAESPPPAETEAAAVNGGKKATYNRPCPKSRKSRDNELDSDADVLEEEEVPRTEAVEEEGIVGGNVEEGGDIGEDNVEEQNIVEDNVEEAVEDNIAEKEGAEDPAEVQEEEENHASEVVEDHSDELSAAGSSVQLNGNEGIVTEPEDHADQESCNGTDPDVTISFVDGYEGEEEGSDVDRPRTSEPLVEFPTDSPGKTPASPRRDCSDIDEEEEDEMESVTDDNPPKPDDPVIDVLNCSTESDYKILHHVDKPAHHITSNQRVVKESEYVGNAARSSTGRESEYSNTEYSFGRSLRTLSGRRPMTHDEETSGASTTETSYAKFFTFGKRKAEDLLPKQEPEPKRAKPEEGEESLGFFARLTSPVMNRLRAMKVGSPATPTSHVTGEEVEGKEEMAVALLEAQPASKRCVLM